MLGDDERRDKPQYSFHRAVDQEPTGQTVVHDRFPLDRELHALQQTKTAHVLDDLETVLKVKQTLGQIIAHAAALLQHSTLEQHSQDGESRRAGQRIPAKGGGMCSRRERSGDFVCCQTGADRHSPAESLGQRHDVRVDSQLLIGKQRSGSSHAGLDFVKYQQDIVLATQFAQAFEVGSISNVDTTLPLDRFQHDRRGLAAQRLLQFRQIVQGDIPEAGNQRLEPFLHFLLSGSGQGRHRPAVKRVQHGNDLVPVRAVLLMGVSSSQLDRRFVSLCPAVAKEDFLGERMVHQSLGELHLGLGVIEVRRMQEVLRLLLDGRD